MEQYEIKLLIAERMAELSHGCSGYDEISEKFNDDEVLADLRRALEVLEDVK